MHADILEGRTTKDRNKLSLNNRSPQPDLQLLIREYSGFQILLQQSIVAVRNHLHQRRLQLLRLRSQVRRNLSLGKLSHPLVLIDQRFHSQQIDHARERGAHSYRKLDGCRYRAEVLTNVFQGSEKVGL